MPEQDDDLHPISALQHLLFCERQCALIHLERAWAENRLTVEGNHLHRKAHDGPDERRGEVRYVRGLRLQSMRLRLVGVADVVAFPADFDLTAWLARQAAVEQNVEAQMARKCTDVEDTSRSDRDTVGIGHVMTPLTDPPMPIEYKRGRPKKHDADRVQLCAQALCLEEMLSCPGAIHEGALFYGQTRRRESIAFDQTLRQKTEDAAHRLHELFHAGVTPRATRQPKCDNCSLERLCLPDAMARQSAQTFITRSLRQIANVDELAASRQTGDDL